MMITHKESSINFTPFDDVQSLPTIKTHRRESETRKRRSGETSKHTKKLYFGQKKYSSLSCAMAITPRGQQKMDI
jgi:hypothetical protein